MFQSLVELHPQGDEFAGLCPFHDDKNPSLKVYLKEGKYLFQCFPCNAGGDIFEFVRRLKQEPFPRAVEQVKEFLGKEWGRNKSSVEAAFKPVGEKKKFLTVSLDDYAVFERALAANPAAIEWLQKERGISIGAAAKLNLGFRRSLKVLVRPEDADIADQGWITCPYIGAGRVVLVKYRSLARKAFYREPNMATTLFNLPAIDPFEPLFLVEGEFDAAVLAQAGFHAVSLPAANYKIPPAERDRLMSAESLFLAGDGDQVGQDAMRKLWAELGGSTYLLNWTGGLKDASEVFLKECASDVEKFRAAVNERLKAARAMPAPHIYSLRESMEATKRGPLADDPQRLHFPWPSVDKMVNLRPGSVLSLFATSTGMGKTTLVMNVLVAEAFRGEVILVYSAESDVEEYANLAAAHVLKKDKHTLTPEDYKAAARKLGEIQFYVGRNPDLNTASKVLDLMEAATRRFGSTINVLDHLHFVTRNEQDTVKAQENAMQRMKNMAEKYGSKWVIIGQPRKAKQDARGKRVQISDAKGSESFESDANAVIALHRDVVKAFDPANPPREPYAPKTEVHLLKGRSQGTGPAYTELYFQGDIATFNEISFDAPPVGGM